MNKCIIMSENAEKELIEIANDPEKLKQFVKCNDLMLKLNFQNGIVEGFKKGTIVALGIVTMAFID